MDRHLAAGHGLARYDDARGRPLVVISWGGGRDTDIAGLPPARFGQGTLSSYVVAPAEAKAMVSPLLSWDPVPQISRPPVAPSHTEYSGAHDPVMRTGVGNSEWINVERGQVQEELEPPAPPGWWAQRLAQRPSR